MHGWLERGEKTALSVEPTTRDHGDTPTDPETGHPTPMGELDLHPQVGWSAGRDPETNPQLEY